MAIATVQLIYRYYWVVAPGGAPLAPGQAHYRAAAPVGFNDAILVTAVPGRLSPLEGFSSILVVENIRIATFRNEFGDRDTLVDCLVKNVGSESIKAYNVNFYRVTG